MFFSLVVLAVSCVGAHGARPSIVDAICADVIYPDGDSSDLGSGRVLFNDTFFTAREVWGVVPYLGQGQVACAPDGVGGMHKFAARRVAVNVYTPIHMVATKLKVTVDVDVFSDDCERTSRNWELECTSIGHKETGADRIETHVSRMCDCGTRLDRSDLVQGAFAQSSTFIEVRSTATYMRVQSARQTEFILAHVAADGTYTVSSEDYDEANDFLGPGGLLSLTATPRSQDYYLPADALCTTGLSDKLWDLPHGWSEEPGVRTPGGFAFAVDEHDVDGAIEAALPSVAPWHAMDEVFEASAPNVELLGERQHQPSCFSSTVRVPFDTPLLVEARFRVLTPWLTPSPTAPMLTDAPTTTESSVAPTQGPTLAPVCAGSWAPGVCTDLLPEQVSDCGVVFTDGLQCEWDGMQGCVASHVCIPPPLEKCACDYTGNSSLACYDSWEDICYEQFPGGGCFLTNPCSPDPLPTPAPTGAPTASPSGGPTLSPTVGPTRMPTASPTAAPSLGPVSSGPTAASWGPTSERLPWEATLSPTKPSGSTLGPTRVATPAPTRGTTANPTADLNATAPSWVPDDSFDAVEDDEVAPGNFGWTSPGLSRYPSFMQAAYVGTVIIAVGFGSYAALNLCRARPALYVVYYAANSAAILATVAGGLYFQEVYMFGLAGGFLIAVFSVVLARHQSEVEFLLEELTTEMSDVELQEIDNDAKLDDIIADARARRAYATRPALPPKPKKKGFPSMVKNSFFGRLSSTAPSGSSYG